MFYGETRIVSRTIRSDNIIIARAELSAAVYGRIVRVYYTGVTIRTERVYRNDE